ncbi:MAG: strawberry notch family protein [Cyanobacteria bacterium P01_F01_bin.150]
MLAVSPQLSLFTEEQILELVRPYEDNVLVVAEKMAGVLRGHKKLQASTIKYWMNSAFGGGDAEDKWVWKDVYEAQESAYIRLLQDSNQSFGLAGLSKISARGLTHTRRTEESIQLQQFSTPLELGYLAAACAQITREDVVLEPSAGTGLMAVFAQLAGAKLILNEMSDRRSGILRKLFPDAKRYRFNAEQINDLLPQALHPSVVLINPPFSTSPTKSKRDPEALGRHVRSAFLRLLDGGRMVLISADWFKPGSEWWDKAFKGLNANCLVSVGVDGQVYYRNGTTTDTRLSVIDKGTQGCKPKLLNLGTEYVDGLRHLKMADVLSILSAVPNRVTLVYPEPESIPLSVSKQKKGKKKAKVAYVPTAFGDVEPLEYELNNQGNSLATDGLYERYQPSIKIKGAKPHPTPLVESAAMQAVRSPMPTVSPQLPVRIVTDGLLSDTQLEQVVYACDSHARYLPGLYVVDETRDSWESAPEDAEGAVRFRQGYFIGDGTGSGKGRTNAGIILERWCSGYRKAIWLTKNTKLLKDSIRDWVALGGDESDIINLTKISLGQEIGRTEGILFATYDTLKVGGRQGKKSRLDQVIDWAGADFEGVLIMDECHLLGNAVGEKHTFGISEPSQRAVAGVRLQNGLPGARVVYSSATGASRVRELCYAVRLGLWGTPNFPFETRSKFLASMELGGVAIEEVLCRDLKMLGFYKARSLSFEGVEYDVQEVPLSKEQIAAYNTYSDAFKIIHTNIEEALDVTYSSSNRNASLAARSAFESSKQRFFKHVLSAMKGQATIQVIEQALNAGHAAVVQIVSTNEAMLKRRLADIPTEEWSDINVDVSPLECVLNYVKRCFPIHLYQEFVDDDGHVFSEPVLDSEGNHVVCQEALAKRDRLLEQLIDLPYLPGMLDQLLWHFGAEQVAEVTGRSMRVLVERDTQRKYVAKRPESATLDDIQQFREGKKDILIFSKAGGTGEGYHSDLATVNQKHRVHIVPETDWVAADAVQGLGRSHRTNQASAPTIKLMVTNVRGEKRFLSTIARRLDSLGALTRGQRQTGGQGLFSSRDNLESVYAEYALDEFFENLYNDRVEGWSMSVFEADTGLRLTDNQGYLREQLPSIPTFLNRLLALPIADQNYLFGYFEQLLDQRVNEAIASGTYEDGVEVLKAQSLKVVGRQVIHTHSLGSETVALEIERRDPAYWPDSLAIRMRYSSGGQTWINQKSGGVALAVPTDSDLRGQKRVRLIRPNGKSQKLTQAELAKSNWQQAGLQDCCNRWDAQVAKLPAYHTQRFFLLQGLLLPVWDKLKKSDPKVYRLTTDDGESCLGRFVEPSDMAMVAQSLGLGRVQLSASDLYRLAMDENQGMPISDTVRLKRSLVMHSYRLELVGDDLPKKLLEQAGCFSEIIVSQKRWFIPASEEEGIPMLEKLLDLLR